MFKKINIEKNNIPTGFETIYNPLTNSWVLRPINGFSEKYLNRDTFIPKSLSVNDEISTKETNSIKSNYNLTKAKNKKNDEFYTRLEDITNELKHYKDHFKGKVVYCPCDKLFNLGKSNFGRYFIGKFHALGIKKLICTQYNPNGNGEIQIINFKGHGVKWEYNGEYDDSYDIDESLIDTYILNGNGSFDSEECINIMKECDIIVTNPPFSIFRQFVKQIISLNKKFLIIGNQNAITYKEIFPYIKNNEIWLGYTYPKVFEVPIPEVEDEKKQFMDENGIVYQKFGNICWFTNLTHNKRYEPLYLNKTYNPDNYQKYDNYDAIEVSKVNDIPKDYNGIIGVPISFLGKYCPTQFKIIKFRKGNDGKDLSINGKCPYFRILIQKI